MEQGLLIVLSGPAGSGKGTVSRLLLESPEFAFSVSATTRAPRPGETDGIHYHFITAAEFERRIAKGELLEYTNYCGNYYGTLLNETEKILASGRNLLLEIEVEGAMNVKRLRPDAVLIMLLPPSYAVQEQRLRGRATETEDKIRARLRRTCDELEQLCGYDYIVYNYDGGAEACADDIRTIVRAEKCSVRRNPGAKALFFSGDPEKADKSNQKGESIL